MKINDSKKVTVLIPCYNEAQNIADVIKGFSASKLVEHGYEVDIIVIDNNSKDNTAEIARSLGVTVLHEPKKGKGNAMRTAFYNIPKDTDYVLMLDGDNTYLPAEASRLIEVLDSGFCNMVIGSRLGGRVTDGSMTTFNRMGNWVFSHLVRYVYRVNVTDVLTGYYAWTREAVEEMRPQLHSTGFAIEMEMITKMANMGYEIYSVPISYHSRADHSNLNPISDGFRILGMFLKNLFWRPQKQIIAFVTDSVMPYSNGGKERRLYEISKRLVQAEREVHIYTMKYWNGPNSIVHEGVHFHAICKKYPLYVNEKRSIKAGIMFGLSVFTLMFKRFDILDVDHIPVFPLLSARIITWIRGQKLYATWHEVWGKKYWYAYMNGSLGHVGAALERISFKLPDVIISNSNHTTELLTEAGCTATTKTISLGVDLESIFSVPVSIEQSDIIFVGRLISHKNVDQLVMAVDQVRKQYPHIVCKIVGTGPEENNIRDLIGKYNLESHIHMIRSVPNNDDLYALMKASKMLVLPSEREGFGLVVVEANAAGIPVITTHHAHNAAKDLILVGVNGLLSSPYADDIALKIIEVLEAEHEMEPHRGVQNHDWQVVVQKLEKAFS